MDFFCRRPPSECAREPFVNGTTGRGAVTIKAAPSGKGWARYGCLSALLLVIVFFAFVRMRLRNMPLESDEGEFAYVGKESRPTKLPAI
jgi:hypothetical protein